MIEEPEIWGVEAITPDAITLRVTLKTAPMEQWRVARVMRERIKARFDHEGIRAPYPTSVVMNRRHERRRCHDGDHRAGGRVTTGAPVPERPGDNGAVTTFYDEIGGEETITAIVAAFYRGWPRTRCCGPSTPSRTSGRPRSGSGSS